MNPEKEELMDRFDRLGYRLDEICRDFRIDGEMIDFCEVFAGNVNRSFVVTFQTKDGDHKCYFLQRINDYVFKDPLVVMSNIDKVTAFMAERFPNNRQLHFHHTADRRNYVLRDGFWRLSNYIHSFTMDKCCDPLIVKNAGRAFGSFQMMLNEFDASGLSYTIPDFHNTVKRFEKLSEDGRLAEDVREEFDWLMSVRDKACTLTQMYENGELPLRVTHNDTKINNVLFDEKTHDAIVVIDLDTVMPGLVGHDFGDAIRSVANVAGEDCRDISLVHLDLGLFEAFTEGFLSQTISVLTENELDTLPLSCFVLATELATRFLDDYILGNKYFKINYPEHNLVRARCQIALAKDILVKMDPMKEIVGKCAKEFR